MIKQKFMLIISGPTAVGKTDLALQLAHQIPCEIINADMGQLYTPLTIGTAKPDWRTMPITHHLFDIIDKPRYCTIVEYRKHLLPLLDDIWKRNKLPIIVGGSLFYIQSILFPPVEGETKFEIGDMGDGQNLWEKLQKIDPERAKQIHPNDHYRIKRALEIWYTTGKKPSAYKSLYQPPSNYWLFFLTRDRKELYERINQRVKIMIESGWIDETNALDTSWKAFLKKKKIIGYDDILSFIDNEIEKEYLIETIAQKTRKYAKRQETFWKMLKDKTECAIQAAEKQALLSSEVVTLDLTFLDLTLYIKQLSEQLKILF